MEFNPVGWFEIYVDNLDRAKSFYESVFKVTLTELPQVMENGPKMLAWPMEDNVKGASGAICKMENVKAGTGGTMVYFSCNDCQQEASRVMTAGGELVSDKFPIGPFGFIAIAKDTEGNTIGLHSNK